MPDDIGAIVERLQDRQTFERNYAAFGILPNDLYGKAATLIEQQAATILDLRERLAKAEGALHRIDHACPSHMVSRPTPQDARSMQAIARAYFAALEPKQ